jgi:hypothetical protein
VISIIIPLEIVDRARLYRNSHFEHTNFIGSSWCDGAMGIKGHFMGINVKSIWEDEVEIRLCKHCRQTLGEK